MSNLATILTATVDAHADRVAIKLDDLELPYTVIDQGAARVAGLLAQNGVQAGDRVGLMLPNVPYSRWPSSGSCGSAPSWCR